VKRQNEAGAYRRKGVREMTSTGHESLRKFDRMARFVAGALLVALALGLVLTAGQAGASTSTDPCPNGDCGGGGSGGDTVAPTVTSVFPANGASDVLPAANVTVTFSEEMELASITSSTFTLVRQGQTTPVAATVSYDSATSTATLNPDADLAQKASYTATVKGGSGGVTDLAGNPLAADHTWSFTVPDTTKPIVSLTSPAAGAYVRGTVQIGATASDNVGMSHVALRVQGGAWSEYDYSAPYGMSWDSTQSLDGSVTLQAIAYDTSWNWADHSYNFIVDNTVPWVTITSGPNGGSYAAGSTQAWNFSAGDATSGLASVQCSVVTSGSPENFEPCSGGNSSHSVTNKPEGSYTFTVKARDNVGLETTQSRTFSIDTTPPETTITSGSSGPTKDNTPTFSFGGSDDASAAGNLLFSHKVDGGAWSAYSSATSVTLPALANGPHSFYVRARDLAGNEDQSPATRSFTVDTLKPTISRMSPRHASIIRDTTPTIRATVRDNLTNLRKANIKLYVAGKLISPTKYSYSAATDKLTYNSPRLAKGKKTVRIVVTDAARNVGAKSWYFTIR